MPFPLSDEDVERIMAAVFAGRKIEAIKIYRTATKVGLREAKEFVDALTERLLKESPERFKPGVNGCAKNAAALVLIAVTIYFLARGLLG